jgi:hypothetical protein
MENSKTQVWLNFAMKSDYLKEDKFMELMDISKEVGKLLDYMMHNPAKFTRIN